MRPAAFASRLKRAMIASLSFIDLSINLSATRFPRSRCIASQTTPIPPAPMTRRISYLPPTARPTNELYVAAIGFEGSPEHNEDGAYLHTGGGRFHSLERTAEMGPLGGGVRHVSGGGSRARPRF